MRAIGFAGFSGAAKTTLIVRLIPELNRRGLSVSTIKHAHHGFDLDLPGKDFFAASGRGRARGVGRFRQSAGADAANRAARRSRRSPIFCACWRRSTSSLSRGSARFLAQDRGLSRGQRQAADPSARRLHRCPHQRLHRSASAPAAFPDRRRRRRRRSRARACVAARSRPCAARAARARLRPQATRKVNR